MSPSSPAQPLQTEPILYEHPPRHLQILIPNCTFVDMVHDHILHTTTQPHTRSNRRTDDRQRTQGELVIDWHPMPGSPARYSLVNESCGGCLIRSCTPLIEGMTGRVRTRLPEGTPGHVSVIVAWSRRIDDVYHVGLRYFAPC